MLTKFFTYLLSAYLLILSGAGQLTARPFMGRTAFPQTHHFHKDGKIHSGKIGEGLFNLKPTAENTGIFPSGPIDIKEDEYGSLKKKSNDGNLLAPLFYIRTAEYFHFCTHTCSSFVRKPFSLFFILRVIEPGILRVQDLS